MLAAFQVNDPVLDKTHIEELDILIATVPVAHYTNVFYAKTEKMVLLD